MSNQFIVDREHRIVFPFADSWFIICNGSIDPGTDLLVQLILLNAVLPGHEILLHPNPDLLPNNLAMPQARLRRNLMAPSSQEAISAYIKYRPPVDGSIRNAGCSPGAETVNMDCIHPRHHFLNRCSHCEQEFMPCIKQPLNPPPAHIALSSPS